MTGWGENTINLENPTTLQEEISIHLEDASIHQEDPSIRQEEIETMEIQTQKNITKQASKQKAKQTSIKNWTKAHRVETETSAEGRKRKRVKDTETPEKGEKTGEKGAQKFQFNKKGKLTKEEVAAQSRTNKNIFNWLNHVKTVVEVIEPAEDVEDM